MRRTGKHILVTSANAINTVCYGQLLVCPARPAPAPACILMLGSWMVVMRCCVLPNVSLAVVDVRIMSLRTQAMVVIQVPAMTR